MFTSNKTNSHSLNNRLCLLGTQQTVLLQNNRLRLLVTKQTVLL